MQVCRVFIHSFIHARILFSTTRFSSLHHRNFSNFSPFPMNSPVAKCFQSEAAISSVEVTQEIYHTTNKEKPKTWNFFHLMLLLYLTFTLLWFLYAFFAFSPFLHFSFLSTCLKCVCIRNASNMNSWKEEWIGYVYMDPKNLFYSPLLQQWQQHQHCESIQVKTKFTYPPACLSCNWNGKTDITRKNILFYFYSSSFFHSFIAKIRKST